jgi:hypothetical protein
LEGGDFPLVFSENNLPNVGVPFHKRESNKNITVMFKNGDDLRQDNLVL